MRSLRATLVLAMVASPLAAQAPAPTGSTWKFSNLIGAYCINFLVSPEDAPSLLPGSRPFCHDPSRVLCRPGYTRPSLAQP